MPCIRCVGLEEELKNTSIIDEALCTSCGHRYYKTANHNKSAPMYIKLKGPDPFKDVKLPSKREMYEDSYWKFVKSDAGSEDDRYWYNQMLAQVDMDLQPVGDWQSWVPEPKTEPIHQSPWSFGNVAWRVFQVTCFTVWFVLPLLAMIGIIK